MQKRRQVPWSVSISGPCGGGCGGVDILSNIRCRRRRGNRHESRTRLAYKPHRTLDESLCFVGDRFEMKPIDASETQFGISAGRACNPGHSSGKAVVSVCVLCCVGDDCALLVGLDLARRRPQ